MKKVLILFILILTNFSMHSFTDEIQIHSLNNVLDSSGKEITKGKIYSTLEDIILCDKGIFLNAAGHLIEINSIGYDIKGFFCGWNDDVLWECLKCGTLNKMSRYRCKYCGWDRRN